MIFWSSYDWMLSCLRNKEQKNENEKKIGRISQILKILLEIKLIEMLGDEEAANGGKVNTTSM